MEKFEYKELLPDGKQVKGVMEAINKDEVIKTIRDRGSIPLTVEQSKDSILNKELTLTKPKVKLDDLAMFSKQMSTMINSGMSLVRALNVIGEQSSNKRLKEICREMSIDIQKGNTLSVIMKNYEDAFPPLMLSMVESGELTGRIDNSFAALSIHYTKEAKINRKIKGAMVYPIVLLVVAVAVVTIMLTFLIPVFVDLYGDADLPAATQMLINISDFLRAYWYIILAVIVGLIAGIRAYAKTVDGKYNIDITTSKIPVVGKAVNTIVTSRFTRTLGTLLKSGVPLISALETSANLTNNQILIRKMNYLVEEIKKGKTLSGLLKEIDYFPAMMVSMVSIGEESGDLDGMLEKTADFYDEELESAITTLLNLMEPTMIVIMGIIVGFIVISVMSPLFTFYDAMS